MYCVFFTIFSVEFNLQNERIHLTQVKGMRTGSYSFFSFFDVFSLFFSRVVYLSATRRNRLFARYM